MSALHNKPARVAAAAVAGSALAVYAGPAAAHWLEQTPHSAGLTQADALGAGPVVGASRSHAAPQPDIVSIAVARSTGRHRKPGRQPGAPPGYLNPLRDVRGLIPERIDEGVDFTGSGPVFALGDAVITHAAGDNGGWPGGGWITYRLTSGPDAGLVVYVAEDLTPTVRAGQHVSPSTVIAHMFTGYDGIETGWAEASGMSAESQFQQAGGIGGYGPFPTRIGLNFEELLQLLGVPAAPNRTQPAYGILPANYPVIAR